MNPVRDDIVRNYITMQDFGMMFIVINLIYDTETLGFLSLTG